jgi:hypothetical protein
LEENIAYIESGETMHGDPREAVNLHRSIGILTLTCLSELAKEEKTNLDYFE